jgi:hypothetical protein
LYQEKHKKAKPITKNFKMAKIFDFTIPKHAVAIKSVQVSAKLKGQMNLQMNYIGDYDQTSQNIIVKGKN